MIKISVQRAPTIREEVFKRIRQFVLTGEAAPGTKLIEGKLAQEMGISRTPVREALHKLEMEGLIDSIPRVGYVVREITEEDVEEIIELRVVIETLAAKRASRTMTATEFKHLEQILLHAERCIERKDLRSIIEYNTRFHEGICKASKSKRILAINLTLRDHMLRFRNMGAFVPEIAREAHEGHRRILGAIKKADAGAIERAIRSHLAWTKDDIVRKIKCSADPHTMGG